MECERGKQELSNFLVFLMQQVPLYYNTKMPGKRVSKNIIQLVNFNYYKGKSAKEIADMFYKNARKTSFKKYYTIGQFQLLQRQICEGNR